MNNHWLIGLILLGGADGFTQHVDTSKVLKYGGEIRFQYLYAGNEGWGDAPADHDGYILTRWLAHANFRAGKYLRAFVEFQSSLANSRVSPSAVDNNPLDLHQGFIDIDVYILTKGKVTLRTGRQELSYGSQRLVSARDGPNNRQSFDAVRAMFLLKDFKADVFYSTYVSAKEDIFDDGFSNNTKFWGVYIGGNNLPLLNNIDLYYVGLGKRNAAFDDGHGKELRHSMGARIWSNQAAWQYDVEGLYQFGKFRNRVISSWTASLNTSYKFRKLTFKPEVGLKTELISGDKKYDDGKLQTFNPLFPRGAYFGLAALIGPANLVDVHPSVALNFNSKLKCDLDYDVFWRYTHNDGIYAVNVSLIYSGRNTNSKYIGSQLAGNLVFRPNDSLYFRGEITWFKAGNFLKEAGAGKSILFAGVSSQVSF